MNASQQAVITEARNRLVLAEAVVNAEFDANPSALADPVEAWDARYPRLCAAIRRAADIKGWLHVFLDRGECQLPMPEALA